MLYLKSVCFVDLLMRRCDAKFLNVGNICIEMEFGCLQDIVVKLIVLKSARYEIIWSKISCCFQILSMCDPLKHDICEAKLKASFISIITFELIVAPCDL
jgi:hypothetical protein